MLAADVVQGTTWHVQACTVATGLSVVGIKQQRGDAGRSHNFRAILDGWFKMESTIKMDDLVVSILGNLHMVMG
jgi:hypothetical protein